MATTISSVALFISVIPALFTAAANATLSDASSQAISVLAERAAPLCRSCSSVEDQDPAGAIVLVFDSHWGDQTRVQEILTVGTNKCVARGSFGKSVLLAWPIVFADG